MTLIRRSPVHALPELQNLVDLLRTNIQHRRDALTISEVLEDVFVNTYLPENRRVSPIAQPASSAQAAALAHLEQTVKQLYANFIDLLQVCEECFRMERCVYDAVCLSV